MNLIFQTWAHIKKDLLIYQYNKLGPAEMEEAKDLLSDVNAEKRSYSSSIQSIFNSFL